MIELFNQLVSIGLVPSVIVVGLVILLVPATIKDWKEFVESIGLTSMKQVRDKESESDMRAIKDALDKINTRLDGIDSRLNGMDDKFNDIEGKIEKTSDSIDEVRKQNDLNQVYAIRYRVLDFDNRLREALRNNSVMSKESFDNVLDCLPEYDELCEKHKVTNNKMVRAIRHINNIYAKEEAEGWKSELEE